MPVSETEKAKFLELVLCPRSDHIEDDPRETEEGDGLVFLHDRLVEAAAEIKATNTSSRTGTSFACLRRSDRWHRMQLKAATQ